MKEVIVTRTFTEDLLSGFINCICVDGKDGFFVGSDKGEVVGFSSTSNVFQKYTVGDDTLTQVIYEIFIRMSIFFIIDYKFDRDLQSASKPASRGWK